MCRPPKSSYTVPQKCSTVTSRYKVSFNDVSSGFLRAVALPPFNRPTGTHIFPAINVRESGPDSRVSRLQRRQAFKGFVHTDGVLKILEIVIVRFIEV